MTAIADIIVNKSNPADLQLSQNIKDSHSSNSTTSFAEMISFYKESENKEPVVEKETEPPVENKVKSEEKTDVTEKTEEPEAVEEKNPVEKKETPIKSQKSTEKKDLKGVKEEDSDKIEKKDLKKKVSKPEVSKEQKTEVKGETAAEENNLKYFEEFTASLMNNQTADAEEINVDDSKNEVAIETLIPQENASAQPQLTKVQDSEEMDFSDFAKKPSEKKELKADKEGKIIVQDLRTEKIDESDKNEPKLKTQLKVTSENTATMTMTYAEESVQNDVLSLNNQTASADGSTFQTMLNNQVQQNVPEFVKAGNIVLKDNNQGTINLILHPDDLGNVKIHLSLDGKTLTGHITVATKEALQVFKDNSETLREAFIKNGFDTANFDVSYGNGGNGNHNFGFDQRNDGTNLFGKQMYGSVSGSVSSEDNSGNSEIQEHFGNYSVNIVA